MSELKADSGEEFVEIGGVYIKPSTVAAVYSKTESTGSWPITIDLVSTVVVLKNGKTFKWLYSDYPVERIVEQLKKGQNK